MASLRNIPLWQWLPRPSWRLVMLVNAADEVPQRLPHSGVVLVGSRRNPKWLVFDCPCGTGHRIMLDLEPTHFPHWRVTTRPRLTVWPSVDCRGADRHCHYLIKRGRIIWIEAKEPRI